MDFKQLTLNNLSIDPSLDVNSLQYKAQLNLAINTSQCLCVIDNHIRNLSNQIKEQSNTVQTLNLVLETYLYILLSTSSIHNVDNTKLSSFFIKKKKIDPSYFKAANQSYLENLEFNNYKVWGNEFGTLGYYLYLTQSDLHFAHPSHLVRLSVEALIKNLNLPNYSSYLLNLICSDNIDNDYELYNQSINLIKELNLDNAFNYLLFYESWIKEVLDWYSDLLVKNDFTNPYKSDSSSFMSFNFLLEISQTIIKLGLFGDCFNNLSYKFIHQEITIEILEVIQAINNLIKTKKFTVDSTYYIEDKLINNLFSNIEISNTEFITASSYDLLSINLIGGFNLWYIALAAELINRAYILTHNSSYKNNSVYLLEKDIDFRLFIERVYKLIFYAGHCLKKTNLNHLQMIGCNLRTLSQLDDNFNLQEYNLLT